MQYQSLTVVITQLERRNIIQHLEEKIRLNIELKNQAQRLNEEYRVLQIKTHKELQDVENLKRISSVNTMQNYFQSQVQFDQQMSKEEEEYIQAKTEMEDCYKRLLALQGRQTKMDEDITTLKSNQAELMEHYRQQDEILDSIFGGSYGSELEDKLEGDLDKKMEYKQRIEVTMQRWRNAQVMVQAAYSQLTYAFSCWQNLLTLPYLSSYQMLRIQAASKARNYFVAASQNLSNSHRLLSNVKFPYCDQSEVNTLNRAVTYIFIDCMTRPRHSHAGNVYKSLRDRCYVLVQWINTVISTSVQGDLNQARQNVSNLQSQLRGERIKLMKEKIEEETGVVVDLDPVPDSGIESDEDVDATDVAAEAEKEPDGEDIDEKIKQAQETVGDEGDEEAAAALAAAAVVAGEKEEPKPMALEDLAPAPDEKTLFGDLEAVMANYDKQREDYAKEMEVNRARQEADFQMKLKARRSRKRRMMAQQQELNELMEKEKDTAAVEVPN